MLVVLVVNIVCIEVILEEGVFIFDFDDLVMLVCMIEVVVVCVQVGQVCVVNLCEYLCYDFSIIVYIDVLLVFVFGVGVL